MVNNDAPNAPAEEEAGRTAESAGRLFDLRTVLAVLFAVYGGVLTVMGLGSADDDAMHKTGGIDINLWSGLAMLAVAALFALWVRLRPLRRQDSTRRAESDTSG